MPAGENIQQQNYQGKICLYLYEDKLYSAGQNIEGLDCQLYGQELDAGKLMSHQLRQEPGD